MYCNVFAVQRIYVKSGDSIFDCFKNDFGMMTLSVWSRVG